MRLLSRTENEIYPGGLDPSGDDIYRDLIEQTNFCETERIAVLSEQIGEYGLVLSIEIKKDTRNRSNAKRALLCLILCAVSPQTLMRGRWKKEKSAGLNLSNRLWRLI
jgi:hypothetical protein